MKPDKEQWIDEVMESVEQIKRVKAREGLFDEIEEKLLGRIEDSFSSFQWKLVAATIAILVMTNVFAVQWYVKNNWKESSEEQISYEEALISDYKLYDQ